LLTSADFFLQDIAKYVRDGVDDVPGTHDSRNIQGAIFPIALQLFRSQELPQEDASESDSNLECNMPNPVTEQNITKDVPALTNFHFRDGEYTGEAPLDEIVAGFEDGELSEHCQVFDVGMDEWVSIPTLLERSRMSQSLHASVGVSFSSLSLNGDTRLFSADAGNAEIKGGVNLVGGDDDDDVEIPLLDKNDKKKPARDSSSWGTGQVQSIDPPQFQSIDPPPANDDITNARSLRTKKVGHVQPPPKLMRTVTQAMVQWDMLEDGDRLLLGLSGGKDSLSLLHVLLEFQRKLPIRFDVEVSISKILYVTFLKRNLLIHYEI
jgi:hypothetical protein